MTEAMDKGKSEEIPATVKSTTFDLSEIRRIDQTELEGDLKELYDSASGLIRQAIGTQKMTPGMLRPVVLTVVQQIQKYSDGMEEKLDGSQKKTMALELTKHILSDLHKGGQIPTETYEYVMLGLEFTGDALIDGIKAIYNLAHQVHADIQANGAQGCCARNCCVQ